MKLTSGALSNAAKGLALDMAMRARASHVGGALSVADVLAVLYADVMRHDPARPDWLERDRLYYSKGHACTILYAMLGELGYFDKTELASFGQDGSRFLSHVSDQVPGIEWSTGSLGHAFPVACGVALAKKRRHQQEKIFVVLSDGELDEGSNWEAFLFAAHHRLGQMTVIIDHNGWQSLGRVEEVMNLHPLDQKLSAFQWDVVTVDGHDHASLLTALSAPRHSDGWPRVVIARTIKGRDWPELENTLASHYRTPTADQAHAIVKAAESRS